MPSPTLIIYAALIIGMIGAGIYFYRQGKKTGTLEELQRIVKDENSKQERIRAELERIDRRRRSPLLMRRADPPQLPDDPNTGSSGH